MHTKGIMGEAGIDKKAAPLNIPRQFQRELYDDVRFASFGVVSAVIDPFPPPVLIQRGAHRVRQGTPSLEHTAGQSTDDRRIGQSFGKTGKQRGMGRPDSHRLG